MSAEKWQLFKVFPNRVEADRIATFLQSSEVPVYVDHGALGVGLEGEFKVFVATELAHRARWLISLPEITDAELDFLATGLVSVGMPERRLIRRSRGRPACGASPPHRAAG